MRWSPPRRYGTIFVCGAFGGGSTREQDYEFCGASVSTSSPVGTLLLDIQVPYADTSQWRYWLREERCALSETYEGPADGRLASDGAEYALHARILDLEPVEQRVTLEMHAEMWRDGRPEAEDHMLTINLYFRNELLQMLAGAASPTSSCRAITTMQRRRATTTSSCSSRRVREAPPLPVAGDELRRGGMNGASVAVLRP